MKKMVAFILILLFASIFVASYMPRIYSSHYGKIINNTGQAGLTVSILLFFLFNRKKKIPPNPNDREYN